NTSPGGRPSIGPLPVTGFLNCGSAGVAVKSVGYATRWAGRSFANAPVNLALPNWSRTIGTGVCRASRGSGWLNLWAPDNGLRGVPGGRAANAVRQHGV